MKWIEWNRMSSLSQKGAFAAAEADIRSAVNRHYYSAFQAATAFLLYCKLQPPRVKNVNREAWPHADTPELFRTHLKPFVTDRIRRNDLKSKLELLYKMRVYADYIGNVPATILDLETAQRNAGNIIKVVQQILPGSIT